MPDTQAAKKVVRAFYESYNQKDLDTSFDTYISTKLVNHSMGGAYDRAAWLDLEKTLFPAFDDFAMTVLDQVAEGDKVATRFRLGGTHTGAFYGIHASGNTAFLTATTIDRVVDGQIVERWAELDFGAFLQQLSAPTPSE